MTEGKVRIDSRYNERLTKIFGEEIDFPIEMEDDIYNRLSIIEKTKKKLAKVEANPKKVVNVNTLISGYRKKIVKNERIILCYLINLKKQYLRTTEQQKKDFFNWFFKPILRYYRNKVQLRVICKNKGFPMKLNDCKKCKSFVEYDLDNFRVICKR